MPAPTPEELLTLLPPGPGRTELERLAALGARFRAQHVGRRPGFLHRYLSGLVVDIPGNISFERLVSELAFQARRRELLGEAASPVEKVDQEWELLTFHEPKRGRRQITFKRLRNLLTAIRKIPDMA